MKKILILIILIMISFNSYSNEVIFHEKFYPKEKTKPPVVIALHSSGGYFTVHKAVKPFLTVLGISCNFKSRNILGQIE